MTNQLEICVDSVESAIASEAGGAQRAELCSAFSEGGLTPSLGLIRAVRARVKISLHVLIRPRSGDFLYSKEELEVIREDITLAAQSGADGIVFGVLSAAGTVDVPRSRELIQLARPRSVTFHRALDMTRDLNEGLEDIIATGADRVLTSCAEATAMLGRERIRSLVSQAKGRIHIMVGGSVRAGNVREIAEATGVTEYHAALRRSTPSLMKFKARNLRALRSAGLDYTRIAAHVDDVRALKRAMNAASQEFSIRSDNVLLSQRAR